MKTSELVTQERKQFQQCLDEHTTFKAEPEEKAQTLGKELAQWDDCFLSVSDVSLS
jgi:hypothetical protein